MARKNNSKGFTIIEVALVLAIAGLIFLVVFLALPALQKSQRDNARRQDAGRLVSALQTCASDNGGDLTLCTSDKVATYAQDLSQVTKTGVKTITTAPTSTTTITTYTEADIMYGVDCKGNAKDVTRNAAVWVGIEANNGGVYCANM